MTDEAERPATQFDHEPEHCSGRIDVGTIHDDGPVWVHGRCDKLVDNPRALLDAYGEEIDYERGDLLDNREHHAEKVFNAVRDVLDAIDLVMNLAPNAKPAAVPVSMLRGVITRALEAP